MNSQLITILKNDLEFVDANEDLKCKLCRNVAINAYFATCGCQYCKNCIQVYLENGDKCCPGMSQDCSPNELNFSRDIIENAATNKMISKLIAKCPMESCEHQDSVMNLIEHVRLCQAGFNDCPFGEIGCGKTDINIRNVESHMVDDLLQHSTLMTDWMGKMTNDCDQLKKRCEEVDSLKHKVDELELLRNGADEQLDEMKKELEKLKQVSEQFGEIISTKDDEISALRCELETIKDGTTRIKSKSVTSKCTGEIQSSLAGTSTECGSVVRNPTREVTSITEDVEATQSTLAQFTNNTVMEGLVWRFTCFETSCQPRVFYRSAPFFCAGNKFCLHLWPGGVTTDSMGHVGVSICLLAAESPTGTIWPLKHDLEICLLNQRTWRRHNIVLFEPEEQGEDGEDNQWDGVSRVDFVTFPHFISHQDLADTPGLLVDDSLIVSCYMP